MSPSRILFHAVRSDMARSAAVSGTVKTNGGFLRMSNACPGLSLNRGLGARFFRSFLACSGSVWPLLSVSLGFIWLRFGMHSVSVPVASSRQCWKRGIRHRTDERNPLVLTGTYELLPRTWEGQDKGKIELARLGGFATWPRRPCCIRQHREERCVWLGSL